MALLRRYMNLLKTTMVSFVLSTLIHIGIVSCYYYTYLWLNPDDPGKKKFYSSTTVSPGVNIGGRVIGGGGVQTNHHKSYFLHLVREYYKGLNWFFFVQFSAIYLFILFVFKFFPERARLKEETVAAFNLNSENSGDMMEREKAPRSSMNKLKTRASMRKRNLLKKNKETVDDSYDSFEDEEVFSEESKENTNENKKEE